MSTASDHMRKLADFAARFDDEPVQRRIRKPSVANIIRQMQRAGVDVAGCEVNPRDGTVTVLTGKPVDANEIEIDDATASPDPKWN